MFLRESTAEKDKRFIKFWNEYRFPTSKTSHAQAKLYEYKLMALRFPEESYDRIVGIMQEEFGLQDKDDGVRFRFLKKLISALIPKLKPAKLTKRTSKSLGGNKGTGRAILLGKIEDKYLNGTEQI